MKIRIADGGLIRHVHMKVQRISGSGCHPGMICGYARNNRGVHIVRCFFHSEPALLKAGDRLRIKQIVDAVPISVKICRGDGVQLPHSAGHLLGDSKGEGGHPCFRIVGVKPCKAVIYMLPVGVVEVKLKIRVADGGFVRHIHTEIQRIPHSDRRAGGVHGNACDDRSGVIVRRGERRRADGAQQTQGQPQGQDSFPHFPSLLFMVCALWDGGKNKILFMESVSQHNTVFNFCLE